MAEDYEMEELADMAIIELRDFIDTETQLVNEEHNLTEKLMSIDYVIGHLDERIPAKMKHLHALNRLVTEKLVLVRDALEYVMKKELKIIKEEKDILLKLKSDVKHKEWKAVWVDIKTEKKEEKQVLRVTKKNLKSIHHYFITLMKVMKRSNLIKAIEEDLTSPKEKEQYVKLEEYYFLQIYKFLRAYERIFRHLWKKELILEKKID